MYRMNDGESSAGRVTLQLDRDCFGALATLTKRLGEPSARVFLAQRLFTRNGNDRHMFGAFKNKAGISDRASGNPAPVPGDCDVIERCDVPQFRQQRGWPARVENYSFSSCPRSLVSSLPSVDAP